MKTKKFIKDSQGFTLVELMVVVGIIGILATIAIPNFRKYQAKSKTTEAKIQLSSLYTTEESILLEYDSYASCLSSGGFNPGPDFSNRFYAVGFGDDHSGPDTVARNNGLGACDSITACTGSSCTSAHHFFAGGKAAAGNSNVDLSTFTATRGSIASTGTTFSAAAVGAISASGNDIWSINQDKKMVHENAGY